MASAVKCLKPTFTSPITIFLLSLTDNGHCLCLLGRSDFCTGKYIYHCSPDKKFDSLMFCVLFCGNLPSLRAGVTSGSSRLYHLNNRHSYLLICCVLDTPKW